ncbi:MAG TPA: hypothetical protein VFO32_03425 [Sphingomicrobium sp.]|jgi:hypothetical protein|nr:hypothetical protein [Sphingomicrobium sp.]
MLLKPVLAVCAIALAATSASAYEPQSNSVAKEKPKAEKKICRWLPVTGSNMNQKVCLTAEDWKKAEALSW